MIPQDRLDAALEESLSILNEVRDVVRQPGYVWLSDDGRKVTHLLELARQYTALVSTAQRLRWASRENHALRTGGKR